jgi:hypothetical protein
MYLYIFLVVIILVIIIYINYAIYNSIRFLNVKNYLKHLFFYKLCIDNFWVYKIAS